MTACVVAGLFLNVLPAAAAVVSWSAAKNITGDTNISTIGTKVYAYFWLGLGDQKNTDTVNGVAFTGTGSVSTVGATSDIVLTKGPSPFFLVCDLPPDNLSGGTPLSASYKHLVGGAAYSDYDGDYFTVKLNNLTSGKTYQVELWSSYSQGDQASTKVSDSTGNSVTLKHSITSGYGSPGQYAIGTFTAGGTSLTLKLSGVGPFVPDKGAMLNAIQVRDVTGLVGVIVSKRNGLTTANNLQTSKIYDIRGRVVGISQNGKLAQSARAGIYILKSADATGKIVKHCVTR
ncbi:MAG: hypothetical protein PHC61_18560 [Chitinivibrionales bacterium]|nr:hypothetical protein [Chitinivibrionales bacterium]